MVRAGWAGTARTPQSLRPASSAVRSLAVPIVLDSDGGVDDAAALWWACSSRDHDLVALTVVAGNVGVDEAAANLATVLQAAGRAEVPVVAGLRDPVGPTRPLRRADVIDGVDGLGSSTSVSWRSPGWARPRPAWATPRGRREAGGGGSGSRSTSSDSWRVSAGCSAAERLAAGL